MKSRIGTTILAAQCSISTSVNTPNPDNPGGAVFGVLRPVVLTARLVAAYGYTGDKDHSQM